MRVGMLVTGGTEATGITRALERLFPGHEFPVIYENRRDRRTFHGFTSNRVPPPQARAPTSVESIAKAAVAHLFLNINGDQPPDFLVVLDDLELCNVGNERGVADTFSAAVGAHLDELKTDNSMKFVKRYEDAVRDRLSLHLVKPMIEAWFFADPKALEAAGVPQNAPVVVDQNQDPECFCTTDADYRNATDASCPCLNELPKARRRTQKPKWLGTEFKRETHPKGYLQWLLLAPNKESCTRYHETRDGGRALACLDWSRLSDRPDGHVLFFRSLVADLADALGEAPSTGPVKLKEADVTSLSQRPKDHVIRNL